jgi:hypothetical protein
MKNNTLHYDGLIDESFIAQFAEMLTGALVLHLGQRKDLRKILGFGLELLDNGLRYGSDHRVTFSWKIGDEEIVFELTNKANPSDAERLVKNAEEIKSMSNEELQTEYKKQMLNPDFGMKGGAGLGLMQLVRKGARIVDVSANPSETGEFICHSSIQASIKMEHHA